MSEEIAILDYKMKEHQAQRREEAARLREEKAMAEGRAEGEQNIINMLKSGKSAEEIIKLAEKSAGIDRSFQENYQ